MNVSKIRSGIEHRLLKRLPRHRPMVFGVGLSKTGTSSLNTALRQLGLRTMHYPPLAQLRGDSLAFAWPWWFSRYDGGTDLPVARYFGELAGLFPHARFVYTHRHIDAWLRSCRKHFHPARYLETLSKMRGGNESFARGIRLNQEVYGTPVFDEAKFRESYQRHEKAVTSFFGDSSRFLSLRVCHGEGWEKLCPFLGLEVPKQTFPWVNRTQKERISA